MAALTTGVQALVVHFTGVRSGLAAIGTVVK
jgi:hypothetical protein